MAKELPILMSSHEVRSILDGSKTQKRVIIKPQPPEYGSPIAVEFYHPTKVDKHGEEYPGDEVFGVYGDDWGRPCPYGAPGDRLWVRETLDYYLGDGKLMKKRWVYRADKSPVPPCSELCEPRPDRWPLLVAPSIHMPRSASRILLEITGIKVERLQDISEEDAIAEGLLVFNEDDCLHYSGLAGDPDDWCDHPEKWHLDPRDAYRDLWEAIHGKGSWYANPWAWAITFKDISAGREAEGEAV